MGESGKLRFYELDHESRMRLLKPHSQTSNGLAMKRRTRKEKHLKETQSLQQGKSHPSKYCRVPPVWRGGGAEMALEPVAYRRCSGGSRKVSTANQSLNRYYRWRHLEGFKVQAQSARCRFATEQVLGKHSPSLPSQRRSNNRFHQSPG